MSGVCVCRACVRVRATVARRTPEHGREMQQLQLVLAPAESLQGRDAAHRPTRLQRHGSESPRIHTKRIHVHAHAHAHTHTHTHTHTRNGYHTYKRKSKWAVSSCVHTDNSVCHHDFEWVSSPFMCGMSEKPRIVHQRIRCRLGARSHCARSRSLLSDKRHLSFAK